MMQNNLEKTESGIENLNSILFSTLDERIFFGHLCDFVHRNVKADRTKIYLIGQNQSSELVSIEGKELSLTMGDEHSSVAGHVARTKRPYFSNSVSRDPLFTVEASTGVKSELCVPIMHEGVVIATIHHQIIDSEGEYDRNDITSVLEIINQVQRPIANMKMYLSAKFLNETLVKQIELKEREMARGSNLMGVTTSFQVEDKKIIGNSESMKKLLRIVEKVAASNVNALLSGESGTGKQMIARKIHCLSSRKSRAFVSVDCASMDHTSIDKELFGEEVIENGSLKVKNGLIEVANNGTLFINNIDKLPLSSQSKLTNFISNGMCFRIGGQMPFRSDVRIFVASTRNLLEEVQAGRFREDLYYDISTVNLVVPSLRNRVEDIEILSNFFLNKGHSEENQKSLSPGVLKRLRDYNWPGNVRELQSVMERAYILADGMVIEMDHLSESVKHIEEKLQDSIHEAVDYREMTLEELERNHICRTLDHLGGNKTRTAKSLGITVKTLYNKLHSYGMIVSKEA